MNTEAMRPTSVLHSALGVQLAIIIWILVYCLAYMGLKLLDMTRGLENDLLQSIFREAFTPGVGGYVALYAVHAWLSKANIKFVFWAFSVPVILFMIGLPIYFIIFLPEGWTFSWTEQITRWVGGVATIVGAWIAHQQVGSE